VEAEGEPGALTALNHELRTPLAAIAGYAEAMCVQAFGPLDANYLEVAQTVRTAAAHMLALIDDMAGLDQAAQGRWPLKSEPFDARAPAAEVLRLLDQEARRAGVRLTGDLPARPVAVRADARAMRQILINLVANALAACPRGGDVRLSLAPGAGELVIDVEDDGVGVAPGAAEGVGLKLVRALAGLHGGALSLERRAAGGTRARVRLPAPAKD
jgi:signal transduction histidine kinase